MRRAAGPSPPARLGGCCKMAEGGGAAKNSAALAAGGAPLRPPPCRTLCTRLVCSQVTVLPYAMPAMYRSLAHFSFTCSAGQGRQEGQGRQAGGAAGGQARERAGGGAGEAGGAGGKTVSTAADRGARAISGNARSRCRTRCCCITPWAGRRAEAGAGRRRRLAVTSIPLIPVCPTHLRGRCLCAGFPGSHLTLPAAGWTAPAQTAGGGQTRQGERRGGGQAGIRPWCIAAGGEGCGGLRSGGSRWQAGWEPAPPTHPLQSRATTTPPTHPAPGLAWRRWL